MIFIPIARDGDRYSRTATLNVTHRNGKETMFSRQGRSIAVTSVGDWRIERIIDRLPRRCRSIIRWLRRPPSVWIRVPTGVLLICGGFFGFLPILGFWMLPVGVGLLADDVPLFRSGRSRILDWIEHRHPRWFDRPDTRASGKESR